MFALEKGTTTAEHDGKEYIAAAYRLGGDCDFNFNDKKYRLFKAIIEKDTVTKREKDDEFEQLEKCHDMHHTLLNFSLMQAVGNMQGFKGRNRFDRLDTFIMELNNYYQGISNSVLSESTSQNEEMLISFLNVFRDVYDYCSTFYFISDKNFIEEIIKQGSMPIETVKDLTRYMTLAEEYWERKEEIFKNMEVESGVCHADSRANLPRI